MNFESILSLSMEDENVFIRDQSRGSSTTLYAYGVFDLFHLGHMQALQFYKRAFRNSYLIVGVIPDEDADCQPVMSLKERAGLISSCKWVDQVVYPCTASPTLEFLESLSIDLTILTDIPENQLGKFVVLNSSERMHDNELHKRILKQLDEFTLDCLKDGFSLQDLGLSLGEFVGLNSKQYRKSVSKNLKKSIKKVNWRRKRMLKSVSKNCQSWMRKFLNSFDLCVDSLESFFSLSQIFIS